MTAEKILYATDFSPASDAALGFASSLASDTGAMLYLVHVGVFQADALAAAGPYGYALSDEAVAQEAEEKQQRLNQVRPTVEGVRCERHFLQGDPAEAVLRFALEEGVDLIVVGSHGRTGLSRMLMGSVAEAIVRTAECPVVVVKHPTHLIDDGA